MFGTAPVTKYSSAPAVQFSSPREQDVTAAHGEHTRRPFSGLILDAFAYCDNDFRSRAGPGSQRTCSGAGTAANGRQYFADSDAGGTGVVC